MEVEGSDQNIRTLAPLDTSACTFKGGLCVYAISTKILCAGPYVVGTQENHLTETLLSRDASLEYP